MIVHMKGSFMKWHTKGVCFLFATIPVALLASGPLEYENGCCESSLSCADDCFMRQWETSSCYIPNTDPLETGKLTWGYSGGTGQLTYAHCVHTSEAGLSCQRIDDDFTATCTDVHPYHCGCQRTGSTGDCDCFGEPWAEPESFTMNTTCEDPDC